MTELHIQPGGYDYEFSFPLDTKHECPICLLALRQPLQTSCGHRFCSYCIKNWLGDHSNECPIDKSKLTDTDLFLDHFVEREVLNLKVRCPNVQLGCKSQSELIYIDDHVNACVFKPVMCPNECSATVLQNELDEHLANHCIHRLACCPHCSKAYTFSKSQIHMTSCPSVKISCELCGNEITRNNVSSHLSDSCSKAKINCIFVEYGCQTNIAREEMNGHIQKSTNFHLQLLLSAFKRMNTFIHEMHRNVPFSRQPSLRSEFSTSVVSEYADASFCSDNTLEYHSNEDPDYPPKMDRQISSQSEAAQLSVFELKSKSHSSLGKPDGKMRKIGKSNSMENMMSDLSNKTVDLDQMVMENMIKIKRLQGEIDISIRHNRKELDAKACCGKFVWRIPNFLDFCNITSNRSNFLYSSSFYSSCYGYKFRMRMNVYDKKHTSYLSLHIQIVQGENDEFLDWPFMGTIILSILDCSDIIPKNHITEEMHITERLQAFERPKHDKVSKDYGYKEFIPVNQLAGEYGRYIKNKCLYVKAAVEYNT